ncbi:MAG: hypothetical protein HY747_10615, partial [Elusimicrobia bacterium]|nr:hypothetical protein [Elusimicrobiota bacterium]
MRLRTKVLILVLASVLGQAFTVASFFYLEKKREWFIERTEAIRLHLEEARNFRASFGELLANSVAAVVIQHAAGLKESAAAGETMKSSLDVLAGYAGYRSLKSAFEDYSVTLDVAAYEIERGRSLRNVEKIMKTVAELKAKETAVLRSHEAITEEIWTILRREQEMSAGRMKLTYWILFCVAGGLLLFCLGLAVYWAVDLRRAFETIETALFHLGRGEIPANSMSWRSDELGGVLKALERVGRQSRELHETMVRWDRLAAMGQLAGGVAHEINNPLVGVLGQAELLRERLPENHQARQHVDKIIGAAQRCRKIVRNLLDFARQRDSDFETASFDKIIESAMDMVKSDLEKAGIEIVMEIEPGLPPVFGQPVDLTEVVLNLVMNAKDAMAGGGRLTIRAREDAGQMRIEVEDTGAGIRADVLPRVFEAFYTTKELGKGVGLGLSVCHGIVKNHKGTIFAESAGQGRGAKFTI